jgi:glycosyltransferase involved in cell wall biosynthesis
MSAPQISLVICTYNRAALLRGALESVARQTLDKADYEVLVVDNNSQDSTAAVVEEFKAIQPNLRYAFERKQGLCPARNLGWQIAAGRYVAYIDDDCEMPKHWLALAKQIIDRFAPVAFGGPAIDIVRTVIPKWYKHPVLAAVTQARFLEPNGYTRIIGLNMVLRRNVIQELGGFDPEWGMRGRQIVYGDETALLKKISLNYPTGLYFDPELYVYNIIRPDKLTLSFVIRASFAAGRAAYRVFGDDEGSCRNHVQLVIKAGRTVVAAIIKLGVNTIYRDRQQYPFIQNYVCAGITPYLKQLGALYEEHRSLISGGRVSRL